jgi:hypothetical protein
MPSSGMIRVSEKTRKTLKALALARGESVSSIAEQAVELYRRQQLLLATNAAYATLRTDPAAWQDLTAERAAWDETLLDGLETT